LKDADTYRYQLSARLDPSAVLLQRITSSVRANPKRVVFAEGEEESVIRAALAFQNSGLGKALLVGREDIIKAGIKQAGAEESALEIRVPHSAKEAAPYIEALYTRMQRHGRLYRDCVRMVTNDRNIYAASMLAAGDADAMVTGVTRNYAAALSDVRMVLDVPKGKRSIGVIVIFTKGRVVFVADTSVHEMPTSAELADIAVQAASNRAWRCSRHRPSDFPAANAASASSKPCTSSTSGASISNMTARWPPTWRSTARTWRITPSAASPTQRTSSSCPRSTRLPSQPSCCNRSAA
jgi:hypothetical protein